MAGGRPETSGTTRARIVVCLARENRALCDALEAAGYSVDVSRDVSDVADRTETCDSGVVVICDTSDDDWLRKISDLTDACPETRSILLADLDNEVEFVGAISAGVAGFCLPDVPESALVRTVDSVLRTGAAIPRSLVPVLVSHLRHGRGHEVPVAGHAVDVTDREWDVLHLILQRRSTREMSAALYVSAGTVRCHVSSLLGKLGASDREHAIWLIESGHSTVGM